MIPTLKQMETRENSKKATTKNKKNKKKVKKLMKNKKKLRKKNDELNFFILQSHSYFSRMTII